MKTVLITGATGFLGERLSRNLIDDGWGVRAIVRKSSDQKLSILNQSEIIVCDLDQSIPSGDIFKNVDAIIHCAARVHNAQEFKSPDAYEKYHRTNCTASINLARAGIAAGVPLFVFISTVKVMGDGPSKLDQPYTEIDPVAPADPYGVSKGEAEQNLQKLFESQSTCKCLVIRLPMVYGPGNKGNMRALLHAASRRLPLPLKAVSARRSMLSISNFCDAIKAVLISNQNSHKVFDRYYLTDGTDYTSAELYDTLYKIIWGRSGIFYLPLWILELPGLIFKPLKGVYSRLCTEYRFSSAKFQKQFAWTSKHSMVDEMKNLVIWYKNQSTK